MELQEAHTAATAAALAAPLGALAGRCLVDVGLRQLKVTAEHRWVRPVSYAAGAVAGVSAVLAARHAGSWWLLPAALLWAYALAAAAVCDAFTLRVPTPLVRQAALASGVLLAAASAVTGHWRWAALAALAATAARLILTVCWRFLEAGFGDVRIAQLGGIGLARPTHLGVAAAIVAFALITLGQACGALARGGDRHTLFPYGPALAAAFLVAAVV